MEEFGWMNERNMHVSCLFGRKAGRKEESENEVKSENGPVIDRKWVHNCEWRMNE